MRPPIPLRRILLAPLAALCTLCSLDAPAQDDRSLPARNNRHALIIGVSTYADPATPPLPGARIDRESATQMARAMQVPAANITYLQDEQATGDAIRRALAELNARVEDGDRVFIHYSGHGTRFNDPAAGGCVEALLAHDGGQNGTITNRQMADLLKPMTGKTDKLFVMYDACHSGGLVGNMPEARTRGFTLPTGEGTLRPKFAAISEECGEPVNVRTRNLVVEAVAQGGLPQDIIHLSASRDNEVSFDDANKGGLATQFMRDCMLGDAKDLDRSGAITIDELRICAQEKINQRMQGDRLFKPHNITMTGNAAFVPAWFNQARPQQVAAAGNATAATPALSGAEALRQMHDQRDAKRRVQASLGKARLKIGQDALGITVQSDRAGYVYLALAGSDNKSVYMLFPNDLDKSNRIEAGQRLVLPRPHWRVKAGGPAGTNNLLVIVADGPRDLAMLGAGKAGPFVTSLNDAQGRARLGALLTSARDSASGQCGSPASRRNNPLCSDAFGAALLAVEEVN